MKDSSKAQPEVLRSLKSAASAGGEKRKDQGLTANDDTAPLSDDAQSKAKTATKVLRAGIDHNSKAAEAAVKADPDPRNPVPTAGRSKR